MNKPTKVLAIGGSVVLVALIVLVLVVKIVITPERVRATVLPLAEEQLDRKVDFSGLGVSIFSGITLEGFTVFEADGKQPFVSLDGLVLRYRLLPLLTGKVVVDEVSLVKPRIVVVRNADGSFNFSGIGKTGEGKPSEASTKSAPQGEDGEGIDLLVASVTVRDGEVIYRDHALQPGKPFELTLAAIEVQASDISLDKSFPVELTADLDGAPLTVTAQVDPQQSAGEGTLTLKGLALKNFQALAGDGYPKHLEPLTLDITLNGSGSAEQAALKGDCTLNLAGERLAVRFDAPGLLKQPLPLNVDVSADRLQLDKLLPPQQADTQKAAPQNATGSRAQTAAAKASEEPGPFDIPLKAKGQVTVQSLAYDKLDIEKFQLGWTLVDNLFNIEKLSGLVAGGDFVGAGRVDLRHKGLRYATDLKLNRVQADPLVSAFYPDYRNMVHGGLDLGVKISGRGTQDETLKRNLSGNGQWLISEGRVEGAPLLEGLVTYLGSEELRVLSFKETQGAFTIKDGALQFDSRIDGSRVRMAPKGKVALDGVLDVRLDMRLNPELTRKVAGKGEFASALTDEQGWGVFPLRVKGTMNKPRFTLDSKTARSQVKKKVIDELSKEIFKDEDQKQGEDALRDALKGLFGN